MIDGNTIKNNFNYIHMTMDNKVLSKCRKGVASINDKIIEIDIILHNGTFKDSVLLTDFENGYYDFRYFVGINSIEVYKIKGIISYVVLENIGIDEVTIISNNERVICNPGEQIKLSKEKFTK